jgi:tRNA A-37 threonylcarbamoyl transferase component Bud32
MEVTSKLLADFWEAGYTHRDLHPRNIVVGLNSEGTAWQPYIIDFSSSTHEEQLEEYCYAEGLILAEMATQADDWEVLQEELWALVDEPPEDFAQLMHALALELPF